MKARVSAIVVLLFTLSACQGINNATSRVFSVYKSPSLTLYYNQLEECAINTNLTPRFVADPQEADIAVYFGQVAQTGNNPVYQVGSESIAVVSNQKDLEDMSELDVKSIFVKTTLADLDVWVYPVGDDIQSAFETGVLNGQKPSPNTKLALTTERMIQALLAPTPAIGILPARVVPASLNILYTLDNVPVLATSPQAPSGNLALLYQCLQNNPNP